VHTSNYRVVGFTASVPIGDLVELGRRYDLPVIHDIGSGAIVDLKQFNLRDEPVASESIEAGADLVLFSGDKLLGGPQAGLILGRRAWIERIEKNPLMRALRLDKMTLAALEATLRLYGNPQLAARELPIMAMAAAPVTVLRERAERVAAAVTSLPGIGSVEVQPSVAYLGAGTLPTAEIESVAIRIEPDGMTENELGACLRRGSPPRPPVVPRVQDGAVWLDLRTVMPAQDESLIDALRLACASGHQPA
jgi:L-seryl-tRNA(Ser) seleniumtransferase